MRMRVHLMLGGLAVATAAGVVPFVGIAEAQSPNASPCAQGRPYPPGAPGQTVDDTTPGRGQTVRGRGCASPRSNNTHTFASAPRVVATSTSDADGLYTFSFVVPTDAEDGPHTISTSGTDVVDGVTQLFVSGGQAFTGRGGGGQGGGGQGGGGQGGGGQGGGGQGGGAGGGGGALPRTGNASTAPLTAAGVGLVLIGGFAVTAARRRRTAQVIDS